MSLHLNPESLGGATCRKHHVFRCGPCVFDEYLYYKASAESWHGAAIDLSKECDAAKELAACVGDFLGLACIDPASAYRSMRSELLLHWVKYKASKKVKTCPGCGRAPCDPEEHKTGSCGCEDGQHEPDCREHAVHRGGDQ